MNQNLPHPYSSASSITSGNEKETIFLRTSQIIVTSVSKDAVLIFKSLDKEI